MLALVVQLRIRTGAMPAFLDIVRAHAVRSKELEPGCLRFDVLRPEGSADEVVLYELYRDQAALDAHRGSEHMADYRGRSGDLVAERSVSVCELLE